MSQPKLWRYNLVWDKINRPTGFLDANRKPLRIHEDIAVFYKEQPTYNPQFTKGTQVHSRGLAGNSKGKGKNGCYGEFKFIPATITDENVYNIELLDYYLELFKNYPIISIEDPFLVNRIHP